jgi:hypothetical protein
LAVAAGCAACAWAQAGAAQDLFPAMVAAAYQRDVFPRLRLPAAEARYYGTMGRQSLRLAGAPDTEQFFVLVDRSPNVQAILLFWMSAHEPPVLLGASPVSTGRVGHFDHFLTPLGVFDHSPENPDFRAMGTRNHNRIRGYGVKGMRVYDLGWQFATRGWGAGGEGEMRLQMHATDPDVLEARLGTPQSKGCIRIPGTLNRFLDRFGLLDAAYEAEIAAGRSLWVLSPDRTPVPGAGRYIVVMDSERPARPAWARANATPGGVPIAHQ